MSVRCKPCFNQGIIVYEGYCQKHRPQKIMPPPRLKEYTLRIALTTPEGIQEFIPMLEGIIDDIKGGVEKKEYVNHEGRTIEWRTGTRWG